MKIKLSPPPTIIELAVVIPAALAALLVPVAVGLAVTRAAGYWPGLGLGFVALTICGYGLALVIRGGLRP